MKKRIVAYDTVLGIGDDTFHLRKGYEILSFETDIYGRVRVNINGMDKTISKPMLDRISNIVHDTCHQDILQQIGEISK